MNNLLLDTDSYKSSHWLQYPPNTTSMFSYVESRGGKYDKTVFFGLQYLLREYLSKTITMEMVEEAKAFYAAHGEPFPYEGFKHIVEHHNGKWPVRIKAVAEGTVVPTHNVLMTVESTDPKTFWVVGYLETLLMRVWYPTTVATQSWHCKQIIRRYLQMNGDEAELPFKLHDFGSRGVSSRESAAIGGAAHLVNFMGSDTVAGVVLANKYYNSPMAGFSIPAAEHSTITSWGRSGECAAYKNMLTQFAKPGSLVAVVSDSYNLYDAVEYLWGGELKQAVVDSGATVVIRPDSGDPVDVVVKTVKLLHEKFGATSNKKGYWVLNNVRVIQGDGIDEAIIQDILLELSINNYSASNIAFGMGGALLQKIDRDTQKFAYKCSSVTVDGQERDVFKAPAGEAFKKSKPGKLQLVYNKYGGFFRTDPEGAKLANHEVSMLQTVFENGEVLVEYTLDEIRERSNVL